MKVLKKRPKHKSLFKNDRVVISVGLLLSEIISNFNDLPSLSIALSYREKGYQYTPPYQKKLWDGRTRLMVGNWFPTGLLIRTIKYIEEKLHKKVFLYFEYKRETINDLNLDNLITSIVLRPYQKNAVKKALIHKRGILEFGTGAGKTVIAMSIIKKLWKKTVFTVHTKNLFDQTVEKFTECFGAENIGVYGSGKKSLSLINVCMLQSINSGIKSNDKKLFDLLSNCKVLIADEIHHAKAATWYDSLLECKAEFRYGLTATPGYRQRLIPLEAVTGPIIAKMKAAELIKKDFLVPPKIIFIKSVEGDKCPTGTTYQLAYKTGITNNRKRNKLIATTIKILINNGISGILVLTKHTEHLKNLAVACNKQDINFNAVSGKTTSNQRTDAVNRLKNKDISVLLSTEIFEEGADFPWLQFLINAGSGKDKAKFTQKIGRTLRTYNGKDRAYVIDFLDEFNSHLFTHSTERMKAAKQQKYELLSITKKEIINHVK